MAGLTPEAPSASQQFQMPGAFDQQQMQQMSAMMAMAAAAGVAGGASASPGGMAGGAPLLSPTPAAPSGGDGGLAGALPFPHGVDPMAHAYAQMFTQYLQQAQAYACGSDPTGMGSGMGVSAPPFAPMGQPYGGVSSLSMAPVIAVSVDGMKFQYQLTEDDLHKVFSRYGAVKHIHVDEVGTTAQIAFQDILQAQAAMTDLNGKVLNGLDGTLRLVWANQGPAAMLPPYPMMPPFPTDWGFPSQASASWPLGAAGAPEVAQGVPGASGPADLANMLAMAAAPSVGGPPAGDLCSTAPGGVESTALAAGGPASGGDCKSAAPAHVKGVRKFTCRFLIGIENDKEFQVVRRIIGSKGTNMKRIVKQTEAKLRLRGVGSGYFEGAGQRESSEPLQLCVSCTSSEGYRTAVRLVEELLEGVYSEYRQFCLDNGRPEPDLHASPQLVSAGGRGGGSGAGGGAGGGGGGGDSLSGGGGNGKAQETDEGEGEASNSKRDGRRRGRRSRAKKVDPGKPGVERGDPPPKGAPPVDDIEHMIDQRNEARRQCNFTEADRIRQSLHDKGVALMDEPGARGKGAEVTTWRYWRE